MRHLPQTYATCHIFLALMYGMYLYSSQVCRYNSWVSRLLHPLAALLGHIGGDEVAYTTVALLQGSSLRAARLCRAYRLKRFYV